MCFFWTTVNGVIIYRNGITTWKLPEGAIARLGRGVIRDIAISSKQRSLAVATHIGTWVYEIDTMHPVALFDTERGLVSTVTLSTDGQWIATSNWDGIIKVHEMATQQCVARVQGWHRNTSQLAFSPCGQFLPFGDIQQTFKILLSQRMVNYWQVAVMKALSCFGI